MSRKRWIDCLWCDSGSVTQMSSPQNIETRGANHSRGKRMRGATESKTTKTTRVGYHRTGWRGREDGILAESVNIICKYLLFVKWGGGDLLNQISRRLLEVLMMPSGKARYQADAAFYLWCSKLGCSFALLIKYRMMEIC